MKRIDPLLTILRGMKDEVLCTQFSLCITIIFVCKESTLYLWSGSLTNNNNNKKKMMHIIPHWNENAITLIYYIIFLIIFCITNNIFKY